MARTESAFPRTRLKEAELHELLLGHFAGILRVRPAEIDPAKSFDEYGLDSIDAVIATESIGRLLDVELPPEFLFINRSLGAVAQALLRVPNTYASSEGPESKEVPIFCLPYGGLIGHPLVRFSEQNAGTLTVKFVRVGGWRDWIEQDFDLDEVVRRACQYIEAACVDGPVRLIGHSQGGQFAYVTALALARAGRQVEFVGLLDSFTWGPPPQPSQKFSAMELIKFVISLPRPYLSAKIRGRRNAYPSGHARKSVVKWVWRLCRDRAARRKMLMLISRLGRVLFYGPGGVRLDTYIGLRLFSEMWGAWLAQNPSQCLTAPVFLFRSEGPGTFDHDWGARCSDLEVVPVAGDHVTMFDAEHLEDLITRILAAVGSRSITIPRPRKTTL